VVHFFDKAGGAADLKALNRLQRRFASRGVQVLAISGDADSKAALAKRVDGLRLEYPVLRDNHRVVVGRYGISELPITLVVERNGNLFAIGQPRGDEIESEITAELQPLLAR
jgi:peroxiredoxin